MYQSNAARSTINADTIINGDNVTKISKKRGPKPTALLFSSMSDLRAKNKEIGHFFFDHATMKFWGSKVETALFRGAFFITSEKGATEGASRTYSIRQALATGEVVTVGKGREYKSLDAAKDAVKEVVKGNRNLRLLKVAKAG